MADVAISVEGLGKQYRIGGQQAAYKTFRETLVDVAKEPFRRLGSLAKGQPSKRESETIWALKDVSFEVRQGDVVGIIGRNGAGKTTLLKILSRITKPTEGNVDLNGRVGSLLEVGTGFHPELTGRENVFLNGAILGMRRQEIEQNFVEIVSFAEIGKFLDTPVKHYSSGMYVRLAFAIAAHLEPEILLVDEVLAVGDEAFQRKCLGKIGEIAKVGRTVLFVSHNMDAVASLTSKTIVLNGGAIEFQGESTSAIHYYRDLISNRSSIDVYEGHKKNGIVYAKVFTSNPGAVHQFGKPLEFEFRIVMDHKPKTLEFAFQILDERMRPVLNPRIIDVDHEWSREGEITIHCRMPAPRMYWGKYSLRAFLGDRSGAIHYETVDDICGFEIVMDGALGRIDWHPGACAYIEDLEWDVN